jgi:hypothetical protein
MWPEDHQNRSLQNAIAIVAADLHLQCTATPEDADEAENVLVETADAALRETPAGVIIELARLAGTGLVRVAELTGNDPVVVLQELAMAYASTDWTGGALGED